MPYVDRSRRYQDCQQRRAAHLYVLGDKKNLPSFNAVGHHPANQREQKDRNSTQKLVEREQKSRMTQTVDQPALCHDLHPRADAGCAGAEPHQTEVSIMKSFKDSAKGRRPRLVIISGVEFYVRPSAHQLSPALRIYIIAALATAACLTGACRSGKKLPEQRLKTQDSAARVHFPVPEGVRFGHGFESISARMRAL